MARKVEGVMSSAVTWFRSRLASDRLRGASLLLAVTLLMGGCLGGGGDRADDPNIFMRHQVTAAEKARSQEALRHAVAQLEADTRVHRDSVAVVDQNMAVLLRDPVAMRRPAVRDSMALMRQIVDSLHRVNVTLARRRESISSRFDSMRAHAALDSEVIENLTERLSALEALVAARDAQILVLESRVDSLIDSSREIADSNQRLVQLLADTTARLWQIIDSVSDGSAAATTTGIAAPAGSEMQPVSQPARSAAGAVKGYVLILPLAQARDRRVLDGEYRIREDQVRRYVKPIDITRDTIIPLRFQVTHFGTPGRFDLPGLGADVWTIDARRNELVIHDPKRFWGASRYLVLVPLSRR